MFDDNAKDPSAFAFACKSVALRVSTKWIFSLTFQEGVLLLPTGSWLVVSSKTKQMLIGLHSNPSIDFAVVPSASCSFFSFSFFTEFGLLLLRTARLSGPCERTSRILFPMLTMLLYNLSICHVESASRPCNANAPQSRG
jgi:hypothetical protein